MTFFFFSGGSHEESQYPFQMEEMAKIFISRCLGIEWKKLASIPQQCIFFKKYKILWTAMCTCGQICPHSLLTLKSSSRSLIPVLLSDSPNANTSAGVPWLLDSRELSWASYGSVLFHSRILETMPTFEELIWDLPILSLR